MFRVPADPPLRVTVRRKLTVSPVVVIVRGAVIITGPVPVCDTAPSEAMFPFIVNKPPLAKVTVPPEVVVMALFAVIAPAVVRLTPPTVFVFTAPVRDVAPVRLTV